MKAYELYAMGARKAHIAREVGVTKATITHWCRDDRWDERMADIVVRADAASEHATGNAVAVALVKLKGQLLRRVAELETLCGPSNHPATRLKAIQIWLKLAGIDRALPNPTDPTTAGSIALIEDLLPQEKEG